MCIRDRSTVAGVIEPRHVFMRRFALDGTPLSDDTRVNTSPEPDHRNPAVVVTPAGDSVVTWAGKNFEEPGNNTFGAFLQPYDASGNAVGGETLVNVTTAGQQQFPAIATDADGDFLVAWSSLGQDEGNEFGIYARRFERGADRSPPIVGNVFVGGDEHAMREREVLVQHPERMVVTFSEAIDLSPGGARQQWRLLRNGVDESERLAAATYVFNGAANRHEATLDFQTPLPDGDYELIALPTLRDLSGKMLDGDYDAVGGDAFTRRFTITTPEAKGPQLSIATGDLLIDDGVPGAIARDAAGNFILVWPAAGQGLDIRAQRYDVNGNAVGPEIAVNSLLAGDQKQPTVAMDHDGNFAVVWTSINELGEQDADNEDIYLRRFDSAGNPLGAELRVNVSDSGVTSPFVQQRPTIGMSPTGEFVVAWETSAHPGGGGVDIHFQRFNANGSRSGIETRANFEEEDTQRFPHVAMDAYGDFVLTWTSRRQDGSIPVSDGVYARRFSAAEGTLVGSEFLVHRDDVAGEQRRSTVAMDSSGNFVIAWQSVALGAEDIYAQRYASRLNGALSYEFAVGPRFRVNQQTAGPQQRPVVAMDADGDFVVTWQSNHSPQLNDIKYRRYAWNGTAQSDELAIADVGTPTQQTLPQLAMDSQGNFVLGWHAEESPTPGLFAQRFVGFVNSPPAADAGGSYAIAEGQPLQLNAAGSADVDAGHAAQLRYEWDLDGDGAFDDLVAADALATVTWNTLSSLGVVDDGQYAIFVRVTDPLGGVSVDSATLSLSNTAPSQLVLVTGAAIDEGGEAMVTGTFVDPGFRDEHQLRIDWGDGTIETLSIPAGLQWFSFKHVYVDDNLADSFRITARVIDDDEGMSDPAETSQTVANLAPFSLAVQLSDAREGETLTVVGSFLDAGTGDVHDVYVDWDDGQGLVKLPAAAVVARQFTAAHVYRNNRNDVEIRLRVHDDDGGVVQTTRRVNVENASPANVVLTLAVNVVAVDGLVQLSGTFTDAGLDDRHIVDVFWGDDSSPQSIPLPIGARNFVATYRYPLPTAYVISVTVSDEMDELATGTTTVQIICGVSGDTNADCVVNVADLNAVRNFFGTGVPGGPRVPGDVYPFDGVVNVNDLNQVRNQFGVSAPAPQSNHESTIAPRIDEHSVSRSLTALDAVFARWTNNELPPRLLLDDAGQPRGTQRRKAVMSSR